MKISKSEKQATSILTLLCTQSKERPLSSLDISARLQISPTYLKKIIRKLVVAGMVQSVSGNNGGYTMIKKPEEISLLDIHEAVSGPICIFDDDDHTIKNAFEGGMSVDRGLEVLKETFGELDQRIANYLRSRTMAMLLKEILQNEEIPTVDWNHMENHMKNE